MHTARFCSSGGGVYPTPKYLTSLLKEHGTRDSLPPDTLPPWRSMGPEISYPQKGHGTRKGPGTIDTLPTTPTTPTSISNPHPLPPLWTQWLTHACENITFPQLHVLLRAVILIPPEQDPLSPCHFPSTHLSRHVCSDVVQPMVTWLPSTLTQVLSGLAGGSQPIADE